MDKKNISDLLDERKSFFNNHIDEMVAAYNREQELSKEYNGRQIPVL